MSEKFAGITVGALLILFLSSAFFFMHSSRYERFDPPKPGKYDSLNVKVIGHEHNIRSVHEKYTIIYVTKLGEIREISVPKSLVKIAE